MSKHNSINTISFHFNNKKIDQFAGDIIPLKSIFDLNSFENMCTEIIKIRNNAYHRTIDAALIANIMNHHMHLYFKIIKATAMDFVTVTNFFLFLKNSRKMSMIETSSFTLIVIPYSITQNLMNTISTTHWLGHQ
jgi:hypothetical protein